MTAKSKTRGTTPKQSDNGAPRPAARHNNAPSLGKGQSGDTNRRAAAVLEVLAGIRTPSEAAEALACSVNYYYVLERKALAGLLAACQQQPKGMSGPNWEQQLARSKQELEKCRQECLRQAALVRAAERAIGLSAAVPPASRRSQGKPAGGPQTKRRRRPTVRALRAAQSLRQNSSLDEQPPGVEPSLDVRKHATSVAKDKESGDGAQGPQAARSGTC